jgi:hypothetical protein
MLVCDDVRVEMGGTFTLVGVHNERLIAPPGSGPIRLGKLVFFASVGGLSGVELVGFAQRIRELSEIEEPAGAMRYERHDPRIDEHNFVFGDAPMVFPDTGTYIVTLDVEAARRRMRYMLRFVVERAAA